MNYLLDTNIMIAYLREPNLTQEYVDKNFAPLDISNNAIISVVTIGEIKAISLKNNWGIKRIEKVELLLSQVTIADINWKMLFIVTLKLMLLVNAD
jgi:predicted nucleic acid-binding protein